MLHTLRLTLRLLAAVVLAAVCGSTWAQGGPFNCDVVFYQVRDISPNSLLLKFASVSSTVTPTSVYSASQPTMLNSLGYNPVDNYMYALRSSGAEQPTLFRVGQTGYQLVGQINNIAGSTLLSTAFVATAGVFDAAGRYYFAGQATNISPPAIFRVDSIPLTGAMTVAQQYNLSATVVNPGDFDFNGAGGPNGLLLAATGTTFARFTLAANNTSPALGTATVATGTLAISAGSVGSAFYDAFAGKFYTFDNNASTFAEITNPTAAFGTQSTVPTVVPAYTGPPAFAGAVTPTDGTSCPISGSRVADMSITKSDGVTSVPINGITSYTITVNNAGPYPANYAVLKDPAVAGLTKTGVTCTAPGGPPSAVCPPTLSIANLEGTGGQQITVFPPDTSLVFTVNAQVTGAVGSNVSNTATIATGPDFTDPNLGNNVAVDVDTVTAASAVVVTGPQQCPAGTTEAAANLVSNGDFATNVFASGATTIGAQNTYGLANYVARQTGTQTYMSNGVLQNAFPGDASRGIGGGPNWLLSNGKNPTGTYNVWLQPVTGLTVGRVYQSMTYMSNATRPTTSSTTLPDLRLQVNQGAGAITLAAVSATFSTTGGRSNNETGSDTWTLVQGTFTASATAVTLSIANFSVFGSAADTGDVAALAQINLRACLPAIDLSITKSNGGTTMSSLGTTTYTIVIANSSATAASNTLVTDSPAANIAKSSVTCAASTGSTCPASLAVLTFESPGLVIPLVAATNGRVTLTLVATVSGPPGSSATNAVTMSAIDYLDSNLSNNQAEDTDLILGSADLRVSKTNGTSTVAAGGTTGYTLTVSNFGPSTVNGAVLKDPSATGLSCSSVTCTGVTGATSCPTVGSTTIAGLQGGGGIVLPGMISPATISFFVTCDITATGQ
ncbi:MAG: hypothetical protein JWQ72_967 [Polaromonas sp.]|nr:hypothetical protein [Polaromonas sp.]